MTSSRSAAGQREERGRGRSTPTSSRTRSTTALPGGLAIARRAAAPPERAPGRAGGHARSVERARVGERRKHDRARALACSVGVRHANSLECSFTSLATRPDCVEAAAQPRVDRSPRQVEQPGDLTGRVAEQVAHHDHCALLGWQARRAPRGRRDPAARRVLGRGAVRRARSRARSARARAASIARFTTIRCSHGPNGRRRSKRSRLRIAARNASCAMSSASALSWTTRYAARWAGPVGARTAPRGQRRIRAGRPAPRRARPGRRAPPQDHTTGRPGEVHAGDTNAGVEEVPGPPRRIRHVSRS